MSLLLVPGFMADETLWRDMEAPLARFAPLHYADLRHDSSIEAMARRALENAPPSFLLLGFSMGGYVARDIARLAPERVQALVLVATSTRPDTPALRQRKGAIGKAAPSIAFSGLSRTAVATSLHPKERDNEALIERVRAMGMRLGGEVFRRQSMLERPGDLDRLDEIRCPTLVVAAAQDQLRSLDEARELQAGIPGATLEVIEDSGHMIPIEAPQRLAGVIVPWLARYQLPQAGA
ncbi:alpha/beta hydrolase [Massilia sp. WF1]|uniref:alpha/beta fold hydrolase n=1 Tax=unclassified Massilia TaxID=2609279 RepID=UPI00064982DA|nr:MULTISPECIES: alpha/beta hydrolase [unclassified Massilia]ALK95619.1 alpha/beta hydrolase [Massilia sp. WG5]KLU35281.1 alpha/beta hydrolase [Massilia sp. WF1]